MVTANQTQRVSWPAAAEDDRTKQVDDLLLIWHIYGHDNDALSIHSFAENLKRYAKLAGPDSKHVNHLRYTVARMVGEDAGDMTAVQKVLEHKNLATTQVYLRRVSTKKDTHSAGIRARLGI